MPELINPFTQGDQFDHQTIRWVTSPAHIDDLVDAIYSATEVIVDLETTSLDPYAVDGGVSNGGVGARIVMASFTLPTGPLNTIDPDTPTYVVGLSHPQSPLRGIWRAVWNRLVGAMRDSGSLLTNHNLGFDMRYSFGMNGIDLTDLWFWDTQLSSHLLDENSSTKLKERVPVTFGVERWDDHDLSSPGAAERVPFFELGVYAARDTYWTWRLAVVHRLSMGVYENPDPPVTPDEVEAYRLGQLSTQCVQPMGATLTAMGQRGMILDVDWVKAQIAEQEARIAPLFDKLSRMYEIDGDLEPNFAPRSRWFLQWVEKALEAGDLRVVAVTETGTPQWNKAALKRLSRLGHTVADDLLAYRDGVKKLEFLRGWLEDVDSESKVHATYHAGRVVTGRLSCSNPNMQQVTKALKPAFIPRPGYLIAECDYSQVELRVAAFVSRCETMLTAYREGRDLHRLTASQVTGTPFEEVTKQQRQQAKAVNFGLLYGMGASGLQEYAETSYDVHFTDEESLKIREAFFDAYPELLDWHDRQRGYAKHHGQVVSHIGRVRRLPNIDSWNNELKSRAERQSVNSPVQGFASDVMQMAAASIEGLLPGHDPVPGVQLVATVHDSIVIEVPEDDWQRATARCMNRMIDMGPVLARLGCQFDVPLAVEATVGTRWGLGDIGIIE